MASRASHRCDEGDRGKRPPCDPNNNVSSQCHVANFDTSLYHQQQRPRQCKQDHPICIEPTNETATGALIGMHAVSTPPSEPNNNLNTMSGCFPALNAFNQPQHTQQSEPVWSAPPSGNMSSSGESFASGPNRAATGPTLGTLARIKGEQDYSSLIVALPTGPQIVHTDNQFLGSSSSGNRSEISPSPNDQQSLEARADLRPLRQICEFNLEIMQKFIADQRQQQQRLIEQNLAFESNIALAEFVTKVLLRKHKRKPKLFDSSSGSASSSGNRQSDLYAPPIENRESILKHVVDILTTNIEVQKSILQQNQQSNDMSEIVDMEKLLEAVYAEQLKQQQILNEQLPGISSISLPKPTIAMPSKQLNQAQKSSCDNKGQSINFSRQISIFELDEETLRQEIGTTSESEQSDSGSGWDSDADSDLNQLVRGSESEDEEPSLTKSSKKVLSEPDDINEYISQYAPIVRCPWDRVRQRQNLFSINPAIYCYEFCIEKHVEHMFAYYESKNHGNNFFLTNEIAGYTIEKLFATRQDLFQFIKEHRQYFVTKPINLDKQTRKLMQLEEFIINRRIEQQRAIEAGSSTSSAVSVRTKPKATTKSDKGKKGCTMANENERRESSRVSAKSFTRAKSSKKTAGNKDKEPCTFTNFNTEPTAKKRKESIQNNDNESNEIASNGTIFLAKKILERTIGKDKICESHVESSSSKKHATQSLNDKAINNDTRRLLTTTLIEPSTEEPQESANNIDKKTFAAPSTSIKFSATKRKESSISKYKVSFESTTSSNQEPNQTPLGAEIEPVAKKSKESSYNKVKKVRFLLSTSIESSENATVQENVTRKDKELSAKLSLSTSTKNLKESANSKNKNTRVLSSSNTKSTTAKAKKSVSSNGKKPHTSTPNMNKKFRITLSAGTEPVAKKHKESAGSEVKKSYEPSNTSTKSSAPSNSTQEQAIKNRYYQKIMDRVEKSIQQRKKSGNKFTNPLDEIIPITSTSTASIQSAFNAFGSYQVSGTPVNSSRTFAFAPSNPNDAATFGRNKGSGTPINSSRTFALAPSNPNDAATFGRNQVFGTPINSSRTFALAPSNPNDAATFGRNQVFGTPINSSRTFALAPSNPNDAATFGRNQVFGTPINSSRTFALAPSNPNDAATFGRNKGSGTPVNSSRTFALAPSNPNDAATFGRNQVFGTPINSSRTFALAPSNPNDAATFGRNQVFGMPINSSRTFALAPSNPNDAATFGRNQVFGTPINSSRTFALAPSNPNDAATFGRNQVFGTPINSSRTFTLAPSNPNDAATFGRNKGSGTPVNSNHSAASTPFGSEKYKAWLMGAYSQNSDRKRNLQPSSNLSGAYRPTHSSDQFHRSDHASSVSNPISNRSRGFGSHSHLFSTGRPSHDNRETAYSSRVNAYMTTSAPGSTWMSTYYGERSTPPQSSSGCQTTQSTWNAPSRPQTSLPSRSAHNLKLLANIQSMLASFKDSGSRPPTSNSGQ